ncbi:putative ATPase/DNA-binding SARP family transcriptional activator [Actinoplanes campanulatus]|uniref:Putative ATPase/DNA-binding SARP family transcriptional activator n=1 Tax=Actinoplanes campanulatus TaxID=113559 RepID=A0A7W5AD18_9ACTN|nr:AfsR/SARP family transcriptional regulator [Actinoplanes campanulatus]MBB3093825.1 putative ATPase/DNA-binding SARP family transcriptional activator [Actinoplanes campanulatus]GGN05933.1 hypothetical protein GCM10010109_13470 [Actinoplanes campanulatus]GID35098.1 hypothetical protein Aca09nite_16040 [Actinoplanes campanulatus]
MGISVGVLGPVELRRDEVVVPLAGTPQRVLLARLALTGGRSVPVAELIEALWEGEPPDNAMGNLHSYVSRLRRCTGGEALRREPGGYRLDLPDGAVDAERAERLAATARGQESAAAAVTLGEALALWRGDPLSDVADRMAFAPEVARLGELRRHLREEWLDRLLASGAAAEALPEIEALAVAEPLRERAQSLLMRGLHATGRTPEALAVARTYRERIADEHGIDPSPVMAELQRRILADDPGLRVPVRSGPLAADLIGAPTRHSPAAADAFSRDTKAAGSSTPSVAAGDASVAAGGAFVAAEDVWRCGAEGVGVAGEGVWWRGAEGGGVVGEAGRGVVGTAGDAALGGGGRRRVDRFFGRREEIAAVRAALASGAVTTLVGPGGVGKTRIVREMLGGGELVVELAERSVPEDVAAAVAGALGMRAAPRGGVAALAERLGSMPAVLVLDNCEHLLDAVRALAGELVARCPGLRVLATSRHRLEVAGERVLRIGPLPADDQVALFCDRAALLRADFPDDSRTRELAAEICGLVDGLPLAVELAARRESVFGLAHLRDRLGAGLNVLEPARGGDRATAVSATVEWSYRLLDPASQRLLDRLAVCRGGFGLDALPYFQEDAEPLLAELVDASLVVADPPRYRLLETVRHVGLGHLGPDGERQARDAHARWMLATAAELVDGARRRDPRTYPAMRRELPNLQEALAWLGAGDDGARMAAMLAVIGSDSPDPGLTEQLARCAPERVETESDALRAVAAGTGEWLRGHLPEADRLLTAALDRLPRDHRLRWGALLIRISNGMFAGRPEPVRQDAERMATDTHAPDWARATGVCCSALMDAYGGDPAAGTRWLERYAGALDTEHLDGFVPFTRGELSAGADPERALAWYDRSIAASDRANLIYTGHVARVARAAVLIRLGRTPEAIGACREVLAAVRAANMTAQVWTMIRLSAELLAGLGDTETAAALVAAADDDPMAPVVMGPDRDRMAGIRTAAATAPPCGGGVAGAAELASARLTAYAEERRTKRAALREG